MLVVALLFLASAIYDTGKRESINTYFFQTNEWSIQRPGEPVRALGMNETTLREMLIKKYVNEYFYAIPDTENIATRTLGSSTLANMSSANVFNTWTNNMAKTIETMAENKMLRTVAIDGEIYKPADGDYWIVPYILKTWEKPNDMTIAPKITRGVLQMNIWFEPRFREIIDVGKVLKDSYNRFEARYDPAVIFRFRVNDLEQIE